MVDETEGVSIANVTKDVVPLIKVDPVDVKNEKRFLPVEADFDFCFSDLDEGVAIAIRAESFVFRLAFFGEKIPGEIGVS